MVCLKILNNIENKKTKIKAVVLNYWIKWNRTCPTQGWSFGSISQWDQKKFTPRNKSSITTTMRGYWVIKSVYKTTLTLIYLLLRFFPLPCVKKLIVTLILSSKANVSNGSSVGAEAVKTTLSDIMWPSITFLSIISGLGCGYKFDGNESWNDENIKNMEMCRWCRHHTTWHNHRQKYNFYFNTYFKAFFHWNEECMAASCLKYWLFLIGNNFLTVRPNEKRYYFVIVSFLFPPFVLYWK